MKSLLIILSLITLTSCIGFKAKKSAKEEHPISKAEKKLNKLIVKHPELLQNDTISLDTTSVTVKAKLEADTATIHKKLTNALQAYNNSLDSLSDECNKHLKAFTEQLRQNAATIYECKLKKPVYAYKKLHTEIGDIFLTASTYQIGNEIYSTIKIDSSTLVIPKAVNKVAEKEALRLEHEDGFIKGAELGKKWKLRFFILLSIALAGAGAAVLYVKFSSTIGVAFKTASTFLGLGKK